MKVWVGCDINSRFLEYREKVKELNGDLGLCLSSFDLPQHISLKISFEADEEVAKHCIKDMIEFLKTIKPFSVKIEGLELHDSIIWLRMQENQTLTALHDELDQIGISYAIKQNALDKQFIFHTTIIMDENEENAGKMIERLKGVAYPEELKINTFLIGHSIDDKTYKVDRRIKIK